MQTGRDTVTLRIVRRAAGMGGGAETSAVIDMQCVYLKGVCLGRWVSHVEKGAQ